MTMKILTLIVLCLLLATPSCGRQEEVQAQLDVLNLEASSLRAEINALNAEIGSLKSEHDALILRDLIDALPSHVGGEDLGHPYRKEYQFEGMECRISEGAGESLSFGTYRIEIEKAGNVVEKTYARDGFFIGGSYLFSAGEVGDPTIVVVFGNSGNGRYVDGMIALRLDGEELTGVVIPRPDYSGRGMGREDVWKEDGRLTFSLPLYRHEDSMASPTGGREFLTWDFSSNRWNHDLYHKSVMWDSSKKQWVRLYPSGTRSSDAPTKLEPIPQLLERWPRSEGVRTHTLVESDLFRGTVLWNPYALSYMAYGSSEYVPQIMEASGFDESDGFLGLSVGDVLTFPEIE